MIKKNIILYLFVLIFSNSFLHAEIKIHLKIDDEVVTNLDITKEINYLEILNPNVSKLSAEKKLQLAENSLTNEIIKKKEIEKFSSSEINENSFDDIYKNFYIKVGFQTEKDFSNALKLNKNYNLNEIKNKIKIDLMWNELVYSKYINQVYINEKEIKKKIEKLKNKDTKEYLLYEIVFKKKKNMTLSQTFNEVKLSIQQIGFANTANIYSISDTSKFGGKIGWVNEISLSKNISKQLKNLEVGEISDLIRLKNNNLILKIEDYRLKKETINFEKEFNNQVNSEINRQLNKFSKIFFDKIMLNYSIYEY